MNELPSIAGRMEMTHEDFQRGCQILLDHIQHEGAVASGFESVFIGALSEAVRCSRECCELAKSKIHQPITDASREDLAIALASAKVFHPDYLTPMDGLNHLEQELTRRGLKIVRVEDKP